MINAYDIAYSLAGVATAPLWLLIPKARRKVARALAQRTGHVPARQGDAPAVLIHAVSLGEINATRSLVRSLQDARPGLHVIVTTTTDTGYERGKQLYGAVPNVTLARFPLDFSSSVGRLLDSVRPDVVALMELEVWPNFMRQCELRDIPVMVVNARLTPHSAKRYRLASPVTRRMFSRLTAVAAQERAYADQFVSLGVPANRVTVTGTMKFDTADTADTVPGAADLARDLHLESHEPLWTCGSTGPGEEEIVLGAYRELLKEFPTLRLAIVPRHPERFDEVATLIQRHGFPLRRRSQSSSIRNPQSAIPNEVILGDTMGELRKFYSLATVVLVGRTLLDLGPRQRGSDMIEPAALAKPTLVGPWTQNFAEVMNAFRGDRALYELRDPSDLLRTIRSVLHDLPGTRATALRARQTVVQHQGATAAHVQVILRHLGG